MNLRSIWSVAAAEMRMNRRLARTWLFIVVTLFMCVGLLFNSFVNYSFSSSISSTTLLNSPLMAPYQLYPSLIGFFAIWVIFLAFDVRSRDKRDRLDEVVGVLPITNLELVGGRATGITVLMLIPIVALIAAYWIVGFVVRLTWPESGIREPELFVTLATLFIDMIPNILLWVTLVMAVTVLVRLRVIAAAIALGLVGATIWAQNNVPIYVLNVINTYSVGDVLPSFLAPTFTNLEIITHRAGMLFLSFAFLCFAAVLYPRLDKTNKPRLLIAAVVLLCLGTLSIALVQWQFRSEHTSRVEMAATHEPYSELHQIDTDSVTGRLTIRPGGSTHIDFSIDMRSLQQIDADNELILSLNPGYEIHALRLNGSNAPFQFRDGLLAINVSTPIQPSQSFNLEIEASGDLNKDFAYLDTAVDVISSEIFQAFGLLFQGTEAYINSNRYVALVPDLAWYPLPGAHVKRDLKHIRPRDFFEMDIGVVVPSDWNVAGPGQAEITTAGDSRLVSFQPSAPVHEIAMFASDFERRTTEIEGIEFELLVSPGSMTNVDLFAPVLDELKSHVKEMLESAETYGLSYPYRSFTIVETPINLRSYRGGWRMDTAQSFPGVFAIREGSFLHAGFKAPFDRLAEDKEISEEERLEKILAFLTGYFENDVTGGNIYLAASNNLMQYQTDATGPGAIPLSYLMSYLAGSVSTEQEGFYSAHVTMGTAAQGQSAVGIATVARAADGRTLNRMFYDWHINLPNVWEAMLAQPLGAIEFKDLNNAKSNLHVLHLWGRAMAHLMRDWLGNEQLGLLLSELRTRYAGTNYTYADLVAVANDIGIDITPIFGDWLTNTQLPGFLASNARTVRLPDQQYGVPLYESSFYIENAEPVPGLITVEYGTSDFNDSEGEYEVTQPIKIPGNGSTQIALTSEQPLERIRINPYLSYNRTKFSIDVPRRRVYDEVTRSEMPLVQAASWQYEDGDSVVVDDLDAGFFVDTTVESTGFSWLAQFFTFAFGEATQDQGLNSYGTSGFSVIFDEWSRQQLDQAYGKYRRTLARAFRTSTVANAHFEANLPRSGSWKLEYHMPNPESIGSSFSAGFGPGPGGNINVQVGERRGRQRWGDFDIWVTDGDRVVPIEFDGESIDDGWNLLGEFQLENPLVTVSVSTNTSRGSVVADAIRWTPAS